MSGVIYDSAGIARSIATGIGSVAANTTDGTGTSLPAAVAGKVIRVVALVVVVSGAMNVTFNSKGAGAGTAITPVWPLQATAAGFVLGLNEEGWFDTASGEGLTVTTGPGGTAAILVKYIQF